MSRLKEIFIGTAVFTTLTGCAEPMVKAAELPTSTVGATPSRTAEYKGPTATAALSPATATSTPEATSTRVPTRRPTTPTATATRMPDTATPTREVSTNVKEIQLTQANVDRWLKGDKSLTSRQLLEPDSTPTLPYGAERKPDNPNAESHKAVGVLLGSYFIKDANSRYDRLVAVVGFVNPYGDRIAVPFDFGSLDDKSLPIPVRMIGSRAANETGSVNYQRKTTSELTNVLRVNWGKGIKVSYTRRPYTNTEVDSIKDPAIKQTINDIMYHQELITPFDDYLLAMSLKKSLTIPQVLDSLVLIKDDNIPDKQDTSNMMRGVMLDIGN